MAAFKENYIVIVPDDYVYCNINNRFRDCVKFFKRRNICAEYNWCIYHKEVGTICIAETKIGEDIGITTGYENLWNKIKKYNQRIKKLKRIKNEI